MKSKQVKDPLQDWRESAFYWDKHSNTIRAMLSPLTRALIEEGGIVEGQSVLDVAGGPGEPSLTIAETVGPTGLVMCTDAVAEMVAAAESEAHRRRLKNVKFRQCTAESLPFGNNSFDTVVSRLGAMFFSDPLASLREMLRVTKPGGAVSLAVWYKSELNPFSYVVTEVISRYVATPPAEPDAPGAFRFAEPGKLARILTEAGATQVRERLFKFRIEARVSLEDFWAMRAELSETLREKLAKLTEEQVLRVGREVQDAVREFFPNNLMSFPAQMLIVTGKKRQDSPVSGKA
jgi:ubiquinone/menaquinone biosynthesis C-methylase UbiE